MTTEGPDSPAEARRSICGGHMDGPLGIVELAYANLRTDQLQSELLIRVTDNLSCHGYAYVTGLPIAYDYVAFLSLLGVPIPQYDGELIWELIAEEGMDTVYHSRNRQSLVPHTEYYEWPGLPPRLVALWCIRPADEGGETLLADGGMFLAQLTPEQTEALRRPRGWQSSEGLRQQGMGFDATHPMLEYKDGKAVLRYSQNNMIREGDSATSELCSSLDQFFESHKIAITIEERGLLIWDNHRILHSRTGYRDSRRHLRRVLVE